MMNACSEALRRVSAAVAVALMLAACNSVPPRKAPAKKTSASRPAAKPRPAPVARSTAPTQAAPDRPAKQPPQHGGGAYYKDDGPGDDPPDDLALLPDALLRAEPLHSRANRPYRVFGKQYIPHTRLEPYRQRGTASWYGRRFHGVPTSSGEPYDMYAMTAAHPTLPIPSYARVTHIGNGRSVVVRINDRGPFLHGRIIDLSYTAALKLDYISTGSAAVEVEQLLPDAMASGKETQAKPVMATPEPARSPMPMPVHAAVSTPTPEAVIAPIPMPEPAMTAPQSEEIAADTDPLAPIATTAIAADTTAHVNTQSTSESENTPQYVKNVNVLASKSGQNLFLQLGLFTSRENAESLRNRAATQTAGLFGQIELSAEGGYFRLFTGPYPSLDAARTAAERIGKLLGIQPFTIWRSHP